MYYKFIALMFVAVLAFGSISWLESKAEGDTPTKYEVSDYQGETSYPTQEGKVFAGWYQDEAFTKPYTEDTGEAYAKFVDAKVLSVKKQMRVKDVNAAGTNGIRFLTAIDTLRFAKVVFHVEIPEQSMTYDLEETVAYSSIMVDGVSEPQLASKVFETEEAKYFVAHSLTGIPFAANDSMFRITPYWYTLDGKKVAGTPTVFTVDETLVAKSLFAESVTINGKQLDSAISAWDLSGVANEKITGANLKDDQVIWFSETGSEALVQTTITRKDTSATTTNRESQPLVGIVVSDGTNTNYLGIRASNISYGGAALIGFSGVADPLASWSSTTTIDLDFVLNDNQFYIYENGLFVYKISLQTVLENIGQNPTLAYGLVMGTPDSKNAELEFSNIEFTTESSKINAYQNARFTYQNSAVSSWDLAELDKKKITGSNLAGTQAMWFVETGSEALLQFTATRLDDSSATNRETQPMAGIMVSDGTNSGYLGVRASAIVVNGNWDHIIGRDLFATWTSSANMTADIDIAWQDNQFHIYIDGVFIKTVNASDVVSGVADGATLTVGLVMESSGKTAQMQFSNISYTTDVTEVASYLSGRTMFADSVTVNGVTLNSATDKWDASEVEKHILKGSFASGTNRQPMYFAQTGNTALLQTKITASEDTASYTMAGIYVHDGTNEGYLGVIHKTILYSPWWQWNSSNIIWDSEVLSPWGDREIQLDIALKDGVFYIFRDGVFGTTMDLSTMMPNTSADSELAFGLVAQMESTCEMAFSDIQFTTDAQKVNKFLNGDVVLKNYGTGLGDDLQYNSELYGMNQSNDVEGADPGVFYVSPEEDATYGGYYYMYQTGSTRDEGIEVGPVNGYAFRCYRSKDLYQWELCGTFDQGYSLQVDWGDWPMDAFWAPEVIRNPQDGKYYMYFSAASRPEWGATVEGLSSSSTWSDRLYLGVAVADTPVGPFDMLYDTDATTGRRIPTINFHTGCNTTYDWAAIDASPFFDDDGTLYLYFNKHVDSHYTNLKGVWGMKMKSMTEPDYSTVSYLAKPYKYTVANTAGKIEAYTSVGSTYEWSEGDINEAPFMVKHNGKYYLTYASNGFSAVDYSVHQAISSSPLSGFTKLSSAQGNPVLDGSVHGGSTYNYMNGTAHHSIVKKGDEMWIVYHRHNSTEGVDAGMDRSICADRVQFVTNSQGTPVLTANGPSMSLQWLPESVSGYANLAQSADITLSTGSGKEYLTDELLPFYTVVQNRVMSATSDVTVTMTWDEAVSVSSVMIYNAYNKNNAFSEVTNLRFKLAEGWTERYAVISELEFPARYMSNSVGAFVPCAPAVAEFDALKVTELQFTIPVNGTVNLSEIVVLGNEEQRLTNISDYESFCTVEHDTGIQIDGTLDEAVWADKRWFSNTYLSNTDGTFPVLKATGFTTEKGIYIASVVKDSNLMNDGQHTMTLNSAFDFRILADTVGETTTGGAWKTHHIMIDMRGDVHCDGASNFKRAVTVEGTMNSGNTQSATVEIFIPWEYLGVDTTKGIPSEFSMYPAYRAILPGTTEIASMGCALGITVEDIDKYWKFGNTGYQSGDWKGAIVGDSATGLTKIGVWDVSREHENMVEACAGATKHTIFFRYMYGANFIAEATLVPDGTLGSGTPQGGFYFMDAAGNEHSMLLDMTQYPDGVTLTVVKFGNTFRYYTNGMLLQAETIDSLSASVFPALHAVNADIIFKDYSCKKMSETGLQKYLSTHIFAQQVVVNGQTVSSSSDKWDLSGLANKVVIGNSAGTADPLYFTENGSTALLQTTVTRLDDSTATNRESQPLAGIMVSDGTTSGFIGIRRGCVVYGSTWVEGAIGKDLFTTWAPQNSTAEIAIVLKDNQFHIYVDGELKKTVNVSDAVPGIADEATLAIGLVMNAEGKTAEMQFSDIQFTTDADEVDAFLGIVTFEGTLFTDKVTVNGTTVESAVDNWDVSEIDENILNGSYAMGSSLKSLYFAETGNTMLLHTTMAYTTVFESGKTYQSDLLGGLYVHDGTNSGYFGVRQHGVVYSPWLQWIEHAWPYDVMSTWNSSNMTVEVDIALKDGVFHIYVDNVYSTTLNLSTIMTNTASDAELAFGLTMHADKDCDIQFSDIQFTTDAATVDAFLTEKASAE